MEKIKPSIRVLHRYPVLVVAGYVRTQWFCIRQITHLAIGPAVESAFNEANTMATILATLASPSRRFFPIFINRCITCAVSKGATDPVK
jgi:hypothetical protein